MFAGPSFSPSLHDLAAFVVVVVAVVAAVAEVLFAVVLFVDVVLVVAAVEAAVVEVALDVEVLLPHSTVLAGNLQKNGRGTRQSTLFQDLERVLRVAQRPIWSYG